MSKIKKTVEAILAKFVDAIVKELSNLPPSEWSKVNSGVRRGRPLAAAREDSEIADKKSSKGPKKAAKAKKADVPERRIKRRKKRDVNVLRFDLVQAVRSLAASSPDGVAIGDIAKAVKLEPTEIAFAMNSLRGEGFLKMLGERGKARWFVADRGVNASQADITSAFRPERPEKGDKGDGGSGAAAATETAAAGG